MCSPDSQAGRASRVAMAALAMSLLAGLGLAQERQPAKPAPSFAGPGFAPAAQGDSKANTNHLLGINLSGPADWNSELAFADVFRLSRTWISQQGGKPWGQGPGLQLDAHGWIAKLDPGGSASSPVLTVKRAPLGPYTLLYEGEGRLELWPANRVKVASNEPGRMVVEIKEPGLILTLREVNAEKPIRNIRMVMPGCEETWKGNPFRPGFLQLWKPMNTFRFMDWMHTNGSAIVKWADRPTLEDQTWSAKGIPLEVMIDLCNRQLINPWFCMPHKADDDFVRQFAAMVRDRLDPTLHVYVEYSNEVWNGIFAQSRHAQEKGKELGLGAKERPWEGGGMYYVHRSLEIFGIWEEVFGGRERLVRVLAWQAPAAWWFQNILLPYKDAAKHCDALAIAPYITMCIGPKGNPDAETVAGWTVDQVLDYAESKAFAQSVKWMKDIRKVADQHGLRLIAYEGGQHLVGVGGGENNGKMTELFLAANRHPRMGELYRRYYDAWRQIVNDLFCTFSSIGGWSKWGSWGLAEHYDDTPEKAPKLKATLEWLAANPLENAPPTIKGLADAKAQVGTPLPLKAAIADDGKSRMAVIVSWSSDNPGAVEFANSRSPATEVTFQQPGAYRLTLRASDGFARAEKAITVHVAPAPRASALGVRNDPPSSPPQSGLVDRSHELHEMTRKWGPNFLPPTHIRSCPFLFVQFVQFVATISSLR